MDTALIVTSFSVLLFALAAVVYVSFRFLALVLSMEVGILKEFKVQRPAMDKALADIPEKEAKLKDFIRARMSPTEGDFTPYSDEEAFINENVEFLRRQGMTDDELDAFIRQAVGTDIGKPENTG